MGKARPWRLYGYIGCAVTLIAIFAIPTDIGAFAQYAWFFIAYTLLNAVFYTANNIAYSALTALVTRNSAERVEMGSWRFIFAFSTSYYMTYVLLDENLYPIFSWAINIPLIIALIVTPALVAKWNGMYKLNLTGYVLGFAGRALVVVSAYLGSVPLMLLFTAVAAFGMGPWQGDMNAVIAACSEYTYLTKGKRVDGSMYSCTSLGVKLGGGLGIAITGWLLELSGFEGSAAVQSQSCIHMLYIMYLWIPVAITALITWIMSRMNVERANQELREKRIAAKK